MSPYSSSGGSPLASPTRLLLPSRLLLEHKLRSTRPGVLAYRIQKLRTRRPWVLVAGRSRALPVGAGPRYPQWFQEDFHALRELLRGDKIHPSWPTRCSSGRRRRASSSSCHKPHYLSKPLLSSGRPPRCPSDTTPDSAAVVHAVRDRRQRSATAKPGTPPFPPAGHEPTPAGTYCFFYILLRGAPRGNVVSTPRVGPSDLVASGPASVNVACRTTRLGRGDQDRCGLSWYSPMPPDSC
jgi:hypothetical protein